MRARLYRENVETIDGQMLLDTTWPEVEALPLLVMPEGEDSSEGHNLSEIIGTVTDIQREEGTGWVTGELTVYVPTEIKGLACEADFDQVHPLEDDEGTLVMSCSRLRAVVLGRRPVWNGMVIE